MIDGVSNQPIQDAVLVIEGTTIQSVGPSGSVSVPDGAERINAAGKTIIPGMFAMHTHVAMGEGLERNPRFYNRERIQRDANAYLYYGVTHVLSLGMDLEPMRGFLADQQAGRTSGARMYSSGIGFAAENGFEPGGFADVNRPSTVSEAQEMVRREIEDKNVDAIKIWVDDVRGSVPKLDPEIYGAIIETARMQDIPVFAHMRDLEDGKELIRRGVAALVHTAPEVDEELVQLASDRGVAMMPTLAGAYGARAYAEGASFLSDPGLPRLFPGSVLETLGSAEYQERIANSMNLDEARASMSGRPISRLRRRRPASHSLLEAIRGRPPAFRGFGSTGKWSCSSGWTCTHGGDPRRNHKQRPRSGRGFRARFARSGQDGGLRNPQRQPAYGHHQLPEHRLGLDERTAGRPRRAGGGRRRIVA